MEIFQWLTLEESNNLPAEKRQDLSEELGDVFVYLLRLADKADVDLIEVVRAKMEKNRLKYPAEKVRGSSKEYSEYEGRVALVTGAGRGIGREAARGVAWEVAKTPAYRRTRRQRKQVGMLFGHMKRMLKVNHLRPRGLTGAQYEFLMKN